MRKFVDKIKPILVVCGHLHENFNVTDEIKKTKLINPGKEGKILTI
jgi:Icc-related predicted phosphoesterase